MSEQPVPEQLANAFWQVAESQPGIITRENTSLCAALDDCATLRITWNVNIGSEVSLADSSVININQDADVLDGHMSHMGKALGYHALLSAKQYMITA